MDLCREPTCIQLTDILICLIIFLQKGFLETAATLHEVSGCFNVAECRQMELSCATDKIIRLDNKQYGYGNKNDLCSYSDSICTKGNDMCREEFSNFQAYDLYRSCSARRACITQANLGPFGEPCASSIPTSHQGFNNAIVTYECINAFPGQMVTVTCLDPIPNGVTTAGDLSSTTSSTSDDPDTSAVSTTDPAPPGASSRTTPAPARRQTGGEVAITAILIPVVLVPLLVGAGVAVWCWRKRNRDSSRKQNEPQQTYITCIPDEQDREQTCNYVNINCDPTDDRSRPDSPNLPGSSHVHVRVPGGTSEGAEDDFGYTALDNTLRADTTEYSVLARQNNSTRLEVDDPHYANQ